MNVPIPIAALVVGSNSEVVIRIIAKDQGVQRSNSISYFSVVGNDKAGHFLEVKCLNSDGLFGKIREGQVLRFIGFVSITTASQSSFSPFRKFLIYDASSIESHVCVSFTFLFQVGGMKTPVIPGLLDTNILLEQPTQSPNHKPAH